MSIEGSFHGDKEQREEEANHKLLCPKEQVGDGTAVPGRSPDCAANPHEGKFRSLVAERRRLCSAVELQGALPRRQELTQGNDV